MPTMKELIVRAGKFFSVGILFISCLPVLLPFLCFFSLFGFAFVLPIVCALAGFLYLRKYVGMLYQKLSISIFASDCSPWRGRPPSQESEAPTFFIDLPPSDVHAIETFEAIDPEFDALLISTAPREVQRETIESARDADISAGLGPIPAAYVSADHATRGEDLDVDAIVNDASIVGNESDDDPLGENGTSGQGADGDSSADDESRGTGADVDISAGIGTNKELREDTYAEGARKVRIDGDTTSEDGTRRHEIFEATPAGNENGREGIVKVTSAEDGKRKEGINEDTSGDDANARAGIDEDTSGNDGNRRKRRVDVTSTKDWKRTEGIDEGRFVENGTGRDLKEDDEDMSVENATTRDGDDETPVQIETRRWERDEDEQSEENIEETERDEDEQSEEKIGETERDEDDQSKEKIGETERDEDEQSKEKIGETERDEDEQSKEKIGETGRDEDEQSKEKIGETEVIQGSELRKVGLSKQFSEEEQGDKLEHPNDDKVERSVLVDTERDEGLHTLSSGTKYGRSVETLEDNSSTLVSEIQGKGNESEVESEPEEDTYSELVNEVREINEKEIHKALDGDAKEKIFESLLEPLDEDDQDRTLDSSTAVAPITPHTSAVTSVIKSNGVIDFLPHQAHENDIWICKECGWKYPNAKPSAKNLRNHKKHCNGSPSPGAQASQREGVHAESPRQNESAAKSWRDLEAGSPLAGSLPKEPQSSAPANEERMRCSPSQLEDDEINLLHDHNSKRVPFDDDSEASSRNSRGSVGQSCGVESESFRSIEFEFTSTSESFCSADFAFTSIPSETFRLADNNDVSEVRWASFPSAEGHYHNEQDQLDQVQVQPVTELQLSEDLNAVKGIVGDKHVSAGPLIEDIEELSEFLGIDLPPRSADLPEIEWAKLALEVMKVVVGID